MVKIHFLNVGKGSCTIIQHDNNNVTMIDIDDSCILYKDLIRTDPVKYVKKVDIDRLIFTHPDMDHLSGLNELLSKRYVEKVWDTNNNKNIDHWSDNSP
jgi:beta-lactamase superfamily II metal-dependent hydrolase